MKEIIREMAKSWCRNKCRIREEVLDRQAEVAERIAKTDGLVVIRAPTGFGKTEMWAAPFFAQWRRGEWFAPRMYVVEPMHALLNQMKERMKTYAEALGTGVTIGEDHGEAPSDVYLYTAVVTLTTVDALIYGYLAQRVVKWRKHGVETGYYTIPSGLLASAYIVFDEAHLMQDEFYLGPRILGETICDLVEAGAKIVLSTATLPYAYLKYFRCFEDENLIDLEGLDRGLSIELRDDVLNVEALNEEIECDKRNIVIVNTVRKAREIYKELKCERKAIVHSLMRRKDRLGALGKVENGGVLIGTQTLEAGLDLDLDALYTELSPIDSLVQRLGRVGRRGPGKAVIYSVEKSTPYLKTLTERTKQVLGADPSALNSWKFVKESVEKVYSDEVVKEIAEKGERMYAEALAYLSELSLFSYPPSREVLLRPSHYAILYIIEGPHRDEVTKTELLEGMVKISYRSYKKSRLKYLLDRIDKIYIVEKEKKDGELLVLKPVEKNKLEKLGKDLLSRDELVIFMEDLRDLYDEAGLAVEELGGEDGDVALGEPEEASKSKRRRSKKSGRRR